MGVLSIIWGILAVLGMIVAFTPCLGSLNWINIPFAVVGLIFAAVAMANENTKQAGTAGLVLNGIAIFVGVIRLIMGGGIL